MTLQNLKTKANGKLSDFWDLLLPKQEAYFLKNRKMFQLLATDGVVDGADTVWQKRTPNDELHAIDVDFEFNSPVPFKISVDEWVGRTTGFSVTATVELPDGRVFTRSRSAVPTVVEATYDNTDIDNPVLLTPKSISDWTVETSSWEEVEEVGTPEEVVVLDDESVEEDVLTAPDFIPA